MSAGGGPALVSSRAIPIPSRAPVSSPRGGKDGRVVPLALPARHVRRHVCRAVGWGPRACRTWWASNTSTLLRSVFSFASVRSGSPMTPLVRRPYALEIFGSAASSACTDRWSWSKCDGTARPPTEEAARAHVGQGRKGLLLLVSISLSLSEVYRGKGFLPQSSRDLASIDVRQWGSR